MRREQSIEEISDGRRYRADDLVKIGTNGCLGCCDCCRMDALIVLDPWDIYQLKKASGCGLEKLLNVTVRLEVIDGLIQPVLARADGVCPYLGQMEDVRSTRTARESAGFIRSGAAGRTEIFPTSCRPESVHTVPAAR